MSFDPCCLNGFTWSSKPAGTLTTIASLPTYTTTGSNNSPTTAILLIHDLFGHTFPNIRLLADHYARSLNATVFVPDVFAGELLPWEPMAQNRWHEVEGLQDFVARNGREQRTSVMVACAKELRMQFEKLTVVGFCWGGWGAQHLDSKSHTHIIRGRSLVDCIVLGHPSSITTTDIDDLKVPVQCLCPERDAAFTEELKSML